MDNSTVTGDSQQMSEHQAMAQRSPTVAMNIGLFDKARALSDLIVGLSILIGFASAVLSLAPRSANQRRRFLGEFGRQVAFRIGTKGLCRAAMPARAHLTVQGMNAFSQGENLTLLAVLNRE